MLQNITLKHVKQQSRQDNGEDDEKDDNDDLIRFFTAREFFYKFVGTAYPGRKCKT